MGVILLMFFSFFLFEGILAMQKQLISRHNTQISLLELRDSAHFRCGNSLQDYEKFAGTLCLPPRSDSFAPFHANKKSAAFCYLEQISYEYLGRHRNTAGCGL